VQQKDEGKNMDRMSRFTLTGFKEREKNGRGSGVGYRKKN
jgi:hypothetical protein